MTWQDVIREFKTKSLEGHGAAAVLVLIYLVYGEDYPYNMAKFFKDNLSEKKGWKPEQLKHFKKLLDLSQLQTLLTNMRNKELLLSQYVGDRHYFRINPRILFFAASRYCSWHQREAETQWVKNDLKIYRFLGALKTRDRLSYFKRWSTIELFDFITFYECLAHDAMELGMDEMAKILKGNISSLKMSKIGNANVEAFKKSKAMDKRRQIKSDIDKQQ